MGRSVNGKEKNRTTSNIKGLDSSFNAVLTWKMEVYFTQLDPDFATHSFKYTC